MTLWLLSKVIKAQNLVCFKCGGENFYEEPFPYNDMNQKCGKFGLEEK